MRIIAGRHKGRVLKSPPSSLVRPTSDRLRETLFNILAPRIEGSRFLDLCAGTGAVGIEALSRGSQHVTFVEKSKRVCGLIEENVKKVLVPVEEFDIVCADAQSFVSKAKAKGHLPWDIVYFDPPYESQYVDVLWALDKTELIAGDGILVAEHHRKNPLPDVTGMLRRWRIVKQGDSCLSFYRID